MQTHQADELTHCLHLKFAYCNKNQALRQLEHLLNANLCDFSKKKRLKMFLRILRSQNIVFDLPNNLSKTHKKTGKFGIGSILKKLVSVEH